MARKSFSFIMDKDGLRLKDHGKPRDKDLERMFSDIKKDMDRRFRELKTRFRK